MPDSLSAMRGLADARTRSQLEDARSVRQHRAIVSRSITVSPHSISSHRSHSCVLESRFSRLVPTDLFVLVSFTKAIEKGELFRAS